MIFFTHGLFLNKSILRQSGVTLTIFSPWTLLVQTYSCSVLSIYGDFIASFSWKNPNISLWNFQTKAAGHSGNFCTFGSFWKPNEMLQSAPIQIQYNKDHFFSSSSILPLFENDYFIWSCRYNNSHVCKLFNRWGVSSLAAVEGKFIPVLLPQLYPHCNINICICYQLSAALFCSWAASWISAPLFYTFTARLRFHP